MKQINIGISGGGLIGKEAASVFGKRSYLNGFRVKAVVTAVCDLSSSVLSLYKNVPTIELLTHDYKELLACEFVDVVYVALPHKLYREVYMDVLRLGMYLFGEKPLRIDPKSVIEIKNEAERLGRFVRCSSEMTIFPCNQRNIEKVFSGDTRKIIEIKSGLLQSSDVDYSKPNTFRFSLAID